MLIIIIYRNAIYFLPIYYALVKIFWTVFRGSSSSSFFVLLSYFGGGSGNVFSHTQSCQVQGGKAERGGVSFPVLAQKEEFSSDHFLGCNTRKIFRATMQVHWKVSLRRETAAAG